MRTATAVAWCGAGGSINWCRRDMSSRCGALINDARNINSKFPEVRRVGLRQLGRRPKGRHRYAPSNFFSDLRL